MRGYGEASRRWRRQPLNTGAEQQPGLSVLLMDANEMQRRETVESLRGMGLSDIWLAGSGQEAIDVMAREVAKIDLIICDLDSPNMDSMDFICKVGEGRLNINMAVISRQGAGILGSAERLCEFYGITVVDTLNKPLTYEVLERLILRAQGDQLPEPVASPKIADADILSGLRRYQFEALYQPKVSLVSGRVVGAEALARWHHPELGLIGPDQFVDALEASSNIGELTLIMLGQAAAACARWQRREVGATVSVNLPVSSLAVADYADELLQVISEAGLSPSNVIFELSDTSKLGEHSPEILALRRLRLNGAGLSISDFKSAADARDQLLYVPFSEMKINRRLVADVLVSEESAAQVAATIAMAKELQIPCAAEGVETQATQDYLHLAGCDQMQGYVFSRPLTETEFVVLAKTRPLYPD